MKYISIGAVLKEGTEHILDVAHGGAQFRLTGDKATLGSTADWVLQMSLTLLSWSLWSSFIKWVW